MSRPPLDLFDHLTRIGAITGYTVEPPPLYLSSNVPTLTYSMYAGDELSRHNLRAFIKDLTGLKPSLALRPIQGNVRRDDGTIERTAQIRLAARFRSVEQLEEALLLVRRRYLAAHGVASRAGSWHIPDVRITGTQPAPLRTIAALAHMLPVEGGAVVTLSLAADPPASGMRSFPVFLLDRWQSYLDGKQAAGAWSPAPAAYQTVTAPLLATGR